jgi:hypothetical protein
LSAKVDDTVGIGGIAVSVSLIRLENGSVSVLKYVSLRRSRGVNSCVFGDVNANATLREVTFAGNRLVRPKVRVEVVPG